MIQNDIKKLGFGLMRLPMNGEEVDAAQTNEMVDKFLQKGFTYFDTAYGYINGKSEETVKTALVDRYPRDQFLVATKLPAWADAKNADEAIQMFYTSLKRTGAGYFDYYLLHNCGGERTKVFTDFGIWEFLAKQKQKGLIKNLGFSFHDKADVLEQLLTDHPEMDFVQLQINYADWENDTVQSRQCYEVARAHGKSIIIMEPIKGGSLANLPDDIAQPMKDYAPDRSLSSWALRYAASLEGVITVLSGMSSTEQMEDNLSTFEHFEPLSTEELDVIAEVQSRLANSHGIPCTNCKYCVKDCPMQIPIPRVFSSMNTYLVYNNLQGAKGNYKWIDKEYFASKCIECGQCEMVCPQQIKIIDELKRVAETLED
ncbi:MAG: 4Fe-4S dicluster domain-containing protein [Clostridiales bacterium]|nr:4Fe-4S dicluster domain-containing protein [Clostridiales bacterium]